MSDVAVTVPAHWSASTVDALRASLPHRTQLIPDAMAATSALRANPGLPSRGVLVVCDFGGSGTSITLVDAATNFTRIGETVRFGDFSGDLIDQAILGKAMAELGDAGQTDPSGTAMVGSLTRLREACRMAKHRLSADTATGIAVNLPGQQTSIRLTRNELEHLIDEPVAGFLAALDDTLERQRRRAVARQRRRHDRRWGPHSASHAAALAAPAHPGRDDAASSAHRRGRCGAAGRPLARRRDGDRADADRTHVGGAAHRDGVARAGAAGTGRAGDASWPGRRPTSTPPTSRRRWSSAAPSWSSASTTGTTCPRAGVAR